MLKTLLLITTALAALTATSLMAQDASPQSNLGAFARFDRDKDNKVSPEEFTADRPALFRKIDTNGDKALSADEISAFYLAIAPASDPKTQKRIDSVKNADANADGRVSLDELTTYALADFKKRDKNGDGFLTAEDLVK